MAWRSGQSRWLVQVVLAIVVAVATVGGNGPLAEAQEAPVQAVSVTISPTAVDVPIGGTVTLTVDFTLVAPQSDPTQPIFIGFFNTFPIFGMGQPVPVTPDVTTCRYDTTPRIATCEWRPVGVGTTGQATVTWSFHPDLTSVGNEVNLCVSQINVPEEQRGARRSPPSPQPCPRFLPSNHQPRSPLRRSSPADRGAAPDLPICARDLVRDANTNLELQHRSGSLTRSTRARSTGTAAPERAMCVRA